jgi:PleD family two-component response regulator
MHSEKVSVTIGIGVTGTSGVESLIRQADQALYRAKRLGRDQVAVARLDDPASLREAAE